MIRSKRSAGALSPLPESQNRLSRQTAVELTEANDLEQMLLELTQVGQPKLSLLDKGWHAWIKMNINAINATGATFEIRSEFDHTTPAAAVAELRERVQASLKTLKGD